MEGIDIQAIVRQAVQEFVNNEQAKTEPAHKAELQEERKRREQLERRLNELVEENKRSRKMAVEAERSSTVRAELQRLGVGKIDLAFRAVQDGIVRTEDGSWTDLGPDSISPDALPDTIHKAVAARLSRVSDEERSVLEMASVLGVAFEYRELEELSENPDALDAAIDALVRGGFLVEERRGRVDRRR